MAEAARSQSPLSMPVGMLSKQAPDQIEAWSDTSTPSGSNQNQGGRSSVTTNQTQPTADITLSASNLNIDSELIISASNTFLLKHACRNLSWIATSRS